MIMQSRIYTIGHSNYTWAEFAGLAANSDIGVIIDVRSKPRSRHFHFNKAELRYRLNGMGISYLHLGHLGGAVEDYAHQTTEPAFADDIQTLLGIAGRTTPALMCAEHDPIDCHRFLMVTRHLVEQHGCDVAHIMRDGTVQPNAATEARLVSKWFPAADLFTPPDQRLREAYRRQEGRVNRG
jgi:uncharacterized protein (DUF488 family)